MPITPSVYVYYYFSFPILCFHRQVSPVPSNLCWLFAGLRGGHLRIRSSLLHQCTQTMAYDLYVFWWYESQHATRLRLLATTTKILSSNIHSRALTNPTAEILELIASFNTHIHTLSHPPLSHTHTHTHTNIPCLFSFLFFCFFYSWRFHNRGYIHIYACVNVCALRILSCKFITLIFFSFPFFFWFSLHIYRMRRIKSSHRSSGWIK